MKQSHFVMNCVGVYISFILIPEHMNFIYIYIYIYIVMYFLRYWFKVWVVKMLAFRTPWYVILAWRLNCFKQHNLDPISLTDSQSQFLITEMHWFVISLNLSRNVQGFINLLGIANISFFLSFFPHTVSIWFFWPSYKH